MITYFKNYFELKKMVEQYQKRAENINEFERAVNKVLNGCASINIVEFESSSQKPLNYVLNDRIMNSVIRLLKNELQEQYKKFEKDTVSFELVDLSFLL